MLLARYKVKGHSMEPNIFNNESVFISSIPFLLRCPKKGDIVLFEFRDKRYIKRIKKQNEDKYYLTGDNKKDSFDSRKMGWIDRKCILGKVI